MAYCYPTRSFWLRRPRNPTWTRFMWLNSQSVRFSSTRTLCTQRRCQVHLLPRHQASFARSYCRRRTWLSFRMSCVTCLVSSCCSQWPNRLHFFSNYTSIMCASECRNTTVRPRCHWKKVKEHWHHLKVRWRLNTGAIAAKVRGWARSQDPKCLQCLVLTPSQTER